MGTEHVERVKKIFCMEAHIPAKRREESLNTNPELFPHFKGGFAEYVYIFPGTYVWKIPDDMRADCRTSGSGGRCCESD